MGMTILIEIFFSVKEETRTRGHGVTLAKKPCRPYIFETFHFHKEQNMNGTYYQLIV